MVRTTPERPVGISGVFPELAGLARAAVRLHPRPGTPGVGESSVGGPLLWPADEPWPTCAEHAGPVQEGFAPADVRLRHRILTAAWARPRDPDAPLLTPQEEAVLDRIGLAGRPMPLDGPAPLLPVAQLYARDLPALPRPDGADLLQVLWCAFDHGDDYAPKVLLRRRSSTAVGRVLAEPPAPAVIEYAEYLPTPCVLHPEPVTEYPSPLALPEELRRRIRDWEEAGGGDYQAELSVAPGWKLGGWAGWSFSDPCTVHCEECGAGMLPLLTADSAEWGSEDSWRPVEDAEAAEDGEGTPYPLPNEPTGISVGRGAALQVYRCPTSFDHPAAQLVQ